MRQIEKLETTDPIYELNFGVYECEIPEMNSHEHDAACVWLVVVGAVSTYILNIHSNFFFCSFVYFRTNGETSTIENWTKRISILCHRSFLPPLFIGFGRMGAFRKISCTTLVKADEIKKSQFNWLFTLSRKYFVNSCDECEQWRSHYT